MPAPFSFTLPPELSAREPPEARGLARDQVKLLVIDRARHGVRHARFAELPSFLRPGDLLVFNASRTIPASLQGCPTAGGPCLEIRLSEHLRDGGWLALAVYREGEPALRRGTELDCGDGLLAVVEERDRSLPQLWKLRFSRSGLELLDSIYRLGKPVRYEHVSAPWDLDYYQNVFAREPGSAEMPSAGRPFTWRLLFDLKRAGIATAYVLLHTGLSSYLDDVLDRKHAASEEEYLVGDAAREQINRTREKGGRVVAVGTTVVRAVESAALESGKVEARHATTRLHITAEYRLRAVDGLVTGFHEPEASHLDLLSAFLPPAVIRSAYEVALSERYLWHEFGDVNLIL